MSVKKTKKSINDNPRFNSSLNYLFRVNNLMDSAHILKLEADNNDSNYLPYFSILESIHIEIMPRLTEEENEEARRLMNKARVCLGNNQRTDIILYHFHINELAHNHNLILVDEESLDSIKKKMFGDK